MSRKSRMRRQARSQQVAVDDDDIQIVEAPETDAEQDDAAVDATEGEQEDPIEVLQRNLQRVEAEKADAEKRYAVERQRSQELETQTASHGAARIAQDKALLEQSYAAADAKAKEAQRVYAAHANEGRWDEAAEAQRAMARIETEMARYGDAYQVLVAKEKEPQPRAQTQQLPDFDAQVAQIPDANVRQWAKDHKADLLDSKRLNLAYAADRLAIARGLEPGTDEYLDFLDDQMGYEMEDAENETSPPARQPVSRRTPPVAAPVSRSGGGSVGARSVTLTEDDKFLARQLGQTEKEYAKFKLAAAKSPRYARYAGR